MNRMQTSRSVYYRKSSLSTLIIIACLLVSPVSTNAAGKKEAKASAPKHTTTKTAAPRGKAATKASTKAVPKVDEETARTTFETFTQEWMAKLAEAEEFQRTQKIKIDQSSEGFSAEYTGYLPQRFIEVKKTEYDETPYIGTLTYYERTLRCSGKTKEEALHGPFEQVKTSPVREIFRFTRGKWVY
jgi:hypothetical protein